MSIILKLNMELFKVLFIILIVGVSVMKVLNNLGVNILIKWLNDVILNGKKICGILIELFVEIERINYVVFGIGINVKIMDFE